MSEGASKPSIFTRLFRAVSSRSTFVSPTAALRTQYVRLYGEGYKFGTDALELSAVYACVSKIADTIASLEASVVKVSPDGTRQLIQSHPVHRMISREPNQYLGAYEFWQLICSDALLHGTGYAYISKDPGKPELFYIPAVRVIHHPPRDW